MLATEILTHFSTHSLWLVKIHMGPTKFIWDPHVLVEPMWILTNQRECVGKCVLECVLLAFPLNYNLNFLYHDSLTLSICVTQSNLHILKSTTQTWHILNSTTSTSDV